MEDEFIICWGGDLCLKLHLSQMSIWRIKWLRVKATSLGEHTIGNWWSFMGDYSELLHKQSYINWELWSLTSCGDRDTKGDKMSIKNLNKYSESF